jgi:CRISPR-associated protein Csm4
LPGGLVPRPELPLHLLGNVDVRRRKELKRKAWLPVGCLAQPLVSAIGEACTWAGRKTAARAHNTIRRDTGATGEGGFAPFQSAEDWFEPDSLLDLHLVFDPDRLIEADLVQCVEDIGRSGFGRDASVGLGRFMVRPDRGGRPSGAKHPDAWLTLSPSVPDEGAWQQAASFYRTMTRFGRHGDAAALGNPFKTPVLLADTGAFLTPVTFDESRMFIGQGVGGHGRLSRSMHGTVHQGYAPVLPVTIGAVP